MFHITKVGAVCVFISLICIVAFPGRNLQPISIRNQKHIFSFPPDIIKNREHQRKGHQFERILNAAYSHDLWVVGAGTLGEIVCRKYKERNPNANIVGETTTERNHQHLDSIGVIPIKSSQRSAGDLQSANNLVISIPPSSCPDYAGAVSEAIKYWVGPQYGGSLVFTSSVGVYGDYSGRVVDEFSPLDSESPRSKTLIAAEEAVLAKGGNILRLGGLYHDHRGPHTYWLQAAREGKVIESNADGLVNLIHYDDAADLIVTILSSHLQQTVLMGVDGTPTTKQEICQFALQSNLFANGTPIPQFRFETGSRGKVCDASYSKKLLSWQPKFPSFRQCMLR